MNIENIVKQFSKIIKISSIFHERKKKKVEKKKNSPSNLI